MRERVLVLIVAVMAMVFAVPVMAQEAVDNSEQMIELVRTDIQKQRVAIIGDAMQFTADEAAMFWPIYEEYEAERSEIGDQRVALIQDYADHFQTMTDEKAGELGAQALELEEARTALKKKYFKRLQAEMSPVTAARFLQVENQLTMVLDLQVASQVPLISKPEGQQLVEE
jgi:hypothetical protein